MIHELKCVPEFFEAVASGDKPFEVRRDDRRFEVGDVLQLKEFVTAALPVNPGQSRDTGRMIERRVTYVLRHADFPDGVPDGWCVLGLKPVTEPVEASEVVAAMGPEALEFAAWLEEQKDNERQARADAQLERAAR